MSIEFEKVSYVYDKKTPFEKEAVSDISFKIKDGESLSILGKTGSGKSTILQLMNGIIKPSSGRVIVDGMVTTDKDKVFEIRKRVGLVFQNPEHQFFADTVYQEIAFGPKNFGMDADMAVKEAIRIVDLRWDILSRSPFALSGGEKRKVAIASIIACDPKYLVFDEPTSSLDPSSAKNFFEILKVLKSKGKSVIIVTHSVEEALYNFDRALVMFNGKIVFDGHVKSFIEEDLTMYGLLPPPMVRLKESVKKACGNFRFEDLISQNDMTI
ncbi:energy-coupling factor transporter ATP-binding protein EcfA2 [Athalassotoga saccharophila]|nr:energy-coupling factor transporter ATP-binding protein EcfA2 [Athalassotoga saccharophila]